MFSNVYVLMSRRPRPIQGCRADDDGGGGGGGVLMSGLLLHHLFQAL